MDDGTASRPMYFDDCTLSAALLSDPECCTGSKEVPEAERVV
jgi:hypothetical protein